MASSLLRTLADRRDTPDLLDSETDPDLIRLPKLSFRCPTRPRGAARSREFVPKITPRELRRASLTCRGCDLYRDATAAGSARAAERRAPFSSASRRVTRRYQGATSWCRPWKFSIAARRPRLPLGTSRHERGEARQFLRTRTRIHRPRARGDRRLSARGSRRASRTGLIGRLPRGTAAKRSRRGLPDHKQRGQIFENTAVRRILWRLSTFRVLRA